MDYQAIKALHIIFVVSWFAGLFYMVRLFIYHVESQTKSENEAKILTDQFKIMQHKLVMANRGDIKMTARQIRQNAGDPRVLDDVKEKKHKLGS